MSKARDTVENLRTVLVDGDVTNANFTGADLEIGKGGTGASSAGAARTALGLVVGTDVLAPDGDGSALTGVDSLPSQTSQSGKFLTTNGSAASWGTVAPAGMTLLSTVTASTSSTVDIETTFDSTYDAYVLYVTNLKISNQSERLMSRLKVGGSYPANANSYGYHYQHSPSNGAGYVGVGEDTETAIKITGPVSNSVSTSGFDGVFYIQDPANTATNKRHKIEWHSVYVNNQLYVVSNRGAAWHGGAGTSAMTGIRFFAAAGTITTGTFRLYGIAK